MPDQTRPECSWQLPPHTEPTPVTTALKIGEGSFWADGVWKPTVACDVHTETIRAYQASIGVPVEVHPLPESVREECAVCWGSHGCSLWTGHSGEHRCDHGDGEYTSPPPGADLYT